MQQCVNTSAWAAKYKRRKMPSFWNLFWTMGLGHFLLTNAYSPKMTKYGNKLNIGLTFIDELTEIQTLRILSEKMGFEYSIGRCSNFDDLVNKVCSDL